jgi:aminopeptidase N
MSMRHPTAFALALILFMSLGSSAQAAKVVVTNYDLYFQIFPQHERLQGHARITLENRGGAGLSEVSLLLYRLLDVDSVSGPDGKALPFHQAVVKFSDAASMQVNAANVRLPAPLPPDGRYTFMVKFSGQVYGYAEVMSYVHDSVNEDYTLLRPDALAYPIVTTPSFASMIESERFPFTYTLAVEVPSAYVVASGGTLVEKREVKSITTFSFRSRGPTTRVDIAVAKFTILQNEPAHLSVYVLPADEEGGQHMLKAMEQVIDFYTKEFGPAAGGSGYTAIEIPDGFGSQASNFYFLQSAAAFRDASRLHEMYHEVGHSWNAVAKPGVDRARWFDEAFASYFEALALRHFDGEKAFSERMEGYRERFRKNVQKDARAVETPISDYGKYELGDNSYTKGAWSLYVLHTLVGDADFRQIIRGLLTAHADTPVDFHDFALLAEQVSKRDLKVYFDEWIYGTESSKLLLGNSSIEEMTARYR